MLAQKMMWPFVPEIHLFHSRDKCRKFLMRDGTEPEFIDGVGAQTWCKDDYAVVYMGYRGKRRKELSLLCHEAYHVASMQFSYMGEDNPSDEFLAYGTQVAFHALMKAHERWRRKRDGQGRGSV